MLATHALRLIFNRIFLIIFGENKNYKPFFNVEQTFSAASFHQKQKSMFFSLSPNKMMMIFVFKYIKVCTL
jgi:hypothetical protein